MCGSGSQEVKGRRGGSGAERQVAFQVQEGVDPGGGSACHDATPVSLHNLPPASPWMYASKTAGMVHGRPTDGQAAYRGVSIAYFNLSLPGRLVLTPLPGLHAASSPSARLQDGEG